MQIRYPNETLTTLWLKLWFGLHKDACRRRGGVRIVYRGQRGDDFTSYKLSVHVNVKQNTFKAALFTFVDNNSQQE